ncbi:hypothetical protein K1X84_12460 [bacterium]|nr:hypothetical protein [bacterium]
MKEFLLFSLLEAAVIFYFWPRFIGKRGYHNAAILRDNPHLRIIYYARLWVTPIIFLLFAVMSAVTLTRIHQDILELLFLNAFLLISSVFLGGLISKSIEEKYRVGKESN